MEKCENDKEDTGNYLNVQEMPGFGPAAELVAWRFPKGATITWCVSKSATFVWSKIGQNQ